MINRVLRSRLNRDPSAEGSIFISPSGNDANNGAELTPVLTYSRAAALASAGMTILVRGGVGLSGQTWNKSGNASARITIQPYPGEPAEIDGSGDAPGSNIVGLQVFANYVDVLGLYIHHCTSAGIYFYRCSNSRAKYNLVTWCYKAGLFGESDGSVSLNSNNEFSSNEVHHCVTMNINRDMALGWASGASFGKGQNCSVLDNYIHELWGEGSLAGDGHNGFIQKRNVVVDAYSIGCYPGDIASGGICEGNFCLHTGASDFLHPTRGRMTGIAVARENLTGTLGVDVINNIVKGCAYGLSYFEEVNNSGLLNSEWSYNSIIDPVIAAFSIDPTGNASGNKIRNNAVRFTSPGGTSYVGDLTGYASDHNLFSNCTAFGSSNVSGNPLFANESGITADDFKILTGSPALAAGVDIPAYLYDYFGNLRLSPPAIGAHQL